MAITTKQLMVPAKGLKYELDSNLLTDDFSPKSKNVHEKEMAIATRWGISELDANHSSKYLYLKYDENEDNGLNLRLDTEDNVKLAQSITTAGVSRTLNRIDLRLLRRGTITAGKVVKVKIETDSTGPSGTPVTNGTSQDVLCTAISTSAGWVTFNFSSVVTLASSTKYWIVLEGDYDNSADNNIQWRMDATSSPYTDGDAYILDASWGTAGANQDFLFRVYRDTTSIMYEGVFQLKSGTKYYMVATLDRLFYYTDVSGVWTDVSGYLASGLFTGTVDERFSAVTYTALDYFIITNYIDSIKKWTGLGYASALGGTPPRAKYLAVYKDRLFLAFLYDGGADIPFRIAWSAAGDPEDYADPNGGYKDFYDDEKIIVGIFKQGDYIVVGKEASIHVGYPVQSTYQFQFDRKSEGVGLVSQDLAIVKGDLLFFVGWANCYVFDLTKSVALMNDTVKDQFFLTTSAQYVKRGFSFDFETRGEWNIVVPGPTSEFADVVWVFNYAKGSFWKHELTLDLTCFGKKSQETVITIDDLVGTIDQQLWRINDQTISGFQKLNTFGASDGKIYKLDELVGEDVNVGVESYVDTKDYYFLDEAGKRVVGKVNGIQFKAEGTKIYVSYSKDEGKNYIPIKATGFDLSIPEKIQSYSFRTQATRIRFRFHKSEVGENFKLKMFSFAVQKGGRLI